MTPFFLTGRPTRLPGDKPINMFSFSARFFRTAARLWVVCCLFVYSASAQDYTMTSYPGQSLAAGSNGYYESLPADYASSGKDYPLLVVIHGLGQLGNGSSYDLPKVVSVGIGKRLVERSLPGSFSDGAGTDYSFIVVVPQLVSETNAAASVNAIIDSCLKKYRVMTNRIYLTGTSMGGGIGWLTAGADNRMARRLAAFIPMAAHNMFDEQYAQPIVDEHLPVWAFHNQGDQVVLVYRTNFWIDGVNGLGADPVARKTIFPVDDHDCWTQATDPAFRENGKNIYEWMLGYTRAIEPLPVTLTSFDASMNRNGTQPVVNLEWITSVEENNARFIIERGTDGNTFREIARVSALNNPQGSTYSHADETVPSGVSYYRLSQVDQGGNRSFLGTRMVKNLPSATAGRIIVYPNPVTDRVGFALQSENKGRLLARVFDASGKIVHQSYSDKTTVAHNGSLATDLQPGFYVLETLVDGHSSRTGFLAK